MKHIKSVIITIVLMLYADIQSQPYSVLLIPFTIEQKEGFSFLNDSIFSVFSSTLSKKESLTYIGRDSITKQLEQYNNTPEQDRALLIGSSLNANYVFHGAILAPDSVITIRIKVTDIYQESAIIDFSDSTKVLSEVIPKITLCFVTSYAKILGENLQNEAKKDSITAQSVKKEAAPVEKQQKKPKKTDSPEGETSGSTGFSNDLWKSPVLNICINGLAVSDIDNNGKNEIIIVTPKMIQQYNYTDKKLTKVADLYKPRFLLPISIDIADINQNGSKEIFMTALNTYRTNVLSVVIENNGQGFMPVVKNMNYYLRVIKSQNDEEVLLGQKHNKNYPFRGEVSQITSDKSKYIPGKQLIPSMNVNVLGLAYGRIGKEDEYIVTYDKSNRINVINPNDGETLWESRDDYGGGNFYYKLEGSYAEEHEYLPMRIIIHDITGDGIGEVIAVKNYELTRNILGKFRYYNKNHIEVFSWDGISLNSIWKTGIIYGFIRDFAIGDIDNDGKEEFVAAIVKKEGKSLFFKPESYLIVYELN